MEVLQEKVVSITILIVVAMIPGIIIYKQFDYRPEKTPLQEKKSLAASVESETSSAQMSLDFQAFLPEGCKFIGNLETFDNEKLADKIDGKAELYLASGFVKLYCRRFALSDDSSIWMEAFVFDMGNGRNSFAVYSGQKRSESQKLDISQFSYKTQNALFFVHGKYYVEIVSSAISDKAMETMKNLAKNLVRNVQANANEMGEFDLFPGENRTEEEIILHISDAFGCEKMNQIFSATYNLEQNEVMAFLSRRPSEKDASDLAASYHKFLLANGSTEGKLAVSIPKATIADAMGTWEITFSYGNFLAGVRGAENKQATEKLAVFLYESLQKKIGK